MELAKYATYQDYKLQLDTELKRTTEGFVKIGYLLKVAKDTDILKESGYANVYEFAQAEYGIDKSQVSRFININDRFSEGGYSDRLKEQYQGFGHAKLAIMLQLPDVINEELNPEYSKSEIQAIKEEFDEEKKLTDLEVLMEGEDQEQCCMNSNLWKVLHQLGKDEPELYTKLHEGVKTEKSIYNILVPSGEKVYSVRIQGVGRMMLSLKGEDEPITLISVRSGEKESFSWKEAEHYLSLLIKTDMEAEASWTAVYNEEFPKKVEVAPVQPKETVSKEPKKEPKKESKVQKAKPKAEKVKQPEPANEPEEQIPGQDNIMNHPEYLPNNAENQNSSSPSEGATMENVTKDAEIVEKTPLDKSTAQSGSVTENTSEQEDAEEIVTGAVAGQEDVDDTEDIYQRIEQGIARLNLFVQKRAGEYDYATIEEWKKAYQDALSVAADLERVLNHG